MKPGRSAPQVLVVDDDVTTSRMLQGILGRAGFRATAAFDAAEAHARVRDQAPDLVLLDINLPDVNGLELCRQLHGLSGTTQIPVLFVSSNEDLSSKVRGFEAGGVDYIPKPFAGEEVIARVRTHLRLKQAYESLADLHAERIQRLAGAQESLMPVPADLPEARFQVALRQVTRAGGDVYDVIPQGGQVVDYLVADASGHDLSSSLWTAALKSLVAEYANLAHTQEETLQSLNRALCRVLPSGVFFTLIYARLNRATGRLTVANAGHPPVLLSPAQPGAEPRYLPQEGDVLGAFSDATFHVAEFPVRKGDRFFLYTDGLVECVTPRDLGTRNLLAAVGAHRAEPFDRIPQSVVGTVTGGLHLLDDILLLGVEV